MLVNFEAQPRSFDGDLHLLKSMLQDQQPFAFSKFADGEWAILTGTPINNGEFEFDPARAADRNAQEDLLAAFYFDNPRYFVGIGCPCCMGTAAMEMRKKLQHRSACVTWANIWVNANYDAYLEHILPLYSRYDVHLVANQAAQIKNLPFEPVSFCPIGKNAWSHYEDTLCNLRQLQVYSPKRPKLFLFCAGPLGNILAHRMLQMDPDSTYLDIGSTLNPWLFSGKAGKNRRYLRGESTVRKICAW